MDIQLSQKTRAEMNAATPRAGDWTFHHVLPVRYYFTIGYVCAYVVVNNLISAKVVEYARKCLIGMANNDPNRNSMRMLSGAGMDTPAKATAAMAHAKLCGSPLFGGFAGPNPEQRCDDPKEGPEPNPPLSADEGWWAALQLLRIHVQAIFPTIGSAGEKNLDFRLDDTGVGWFIESLERHITPLSAYPICPFDAGDWKLCPMGDKLLGANWLLAKKGVGAWPKSGNFDKLNKAKNDQAFNALWNPKNGLGLAATLGAKFALRESLADPGGIAEIYTPALAANYAGRVFRQIGDRLVIYVPD